MVPSLVLRSLAIGILLVLPCVGIASAQTPTPLANWQFSAGQVLASLAGPPPEWRAVLGLGAGVAPDYPGAERYKAQPSGIVDLRYRDIAFLSDGEGLGVNLLHGKGYRAGVAISYDLGRYHRDDPRVSALRDVDAAPEAKLFAQYFLLPVVLAADVRKGLGGHDGYIGDLGAYVPLPIGKSAFLFVGPGITFADSRYMDAYFGVDAAHAQASGLRQFTADGGVRNVSFGATAVYLFGEHWLLNADAGLQRLLGDAARSPVTEDKIQFTADLIVGYRF